MKIEKLLMIVTMVLTGLSQTVSAGTVDDEVAQRIKKVGSVCIEGDDCGSATAGAAVTDAGGGGAEDNYKKTCATCHAIGVAGAPKFGNKEDWAPRIAKGIDALYASGVNGLPPGMPAKGMCFTCSEDDLHAIVDYMVDAVK